MKLTKSFEQGVCIMAMLATQADGIPLSSRALQRQLNSSMTYSQKILRKLVVAGLIKSVSGNNGGFTLARPIDAITTYDVVVALEGSVDSFPNSGLISSVFDAHQPCGPIDITMADQAIHRVFATADSVWCQVLREVSLADIVARVLNANQQLPQIDWNDEQATATIGQKGDNND